MILKVQNILSYTLSYSFMLIPNEIYLNITIVAS